MSRLTPGCHPRGKVGAHSSPDGDSEASRRKHQAAPSEPPSQTTGRDAQETGGGPGGSSLREPHQRDRAPQGERKSIHPTPPPPPQRGHVLCRATAIVLLSIPSGIGILTGVFALIRELC